MVHFFLHCSLFDQFRTTLRERLRNIDVNFFNADEYLIVQTMIFGNKKYNLETNHLILSATIEFIISTERFNGNLM